MLDMSRGPSTPESRVPGVPRVPKRRLQGAFAVWPRYARSPRSWAWARNSSSVAPAPSNCPVPRRISSSVRCMENSVPRNWGSWSFPRFWTPEPRLSSASLAPLTLGTVPLAFPSTSTLAAGCNTDTKTHTMSAISNLNDPQGAKRSLTTAELESTFPK